MNLKKLSSFPLEFRFTGSFNEQWSRIGNAVMPKFMEHIDDVVFVGNKDHILEIFPQYLSYSKEWGGVPKASKFIIYFHSLDAYHLAHN